ncbi:hypothetical protein VB145_21035 [Xanthomonas arboricola]|nr:hypothetical protein [Xanthomonas arboricola]MDN0203357.1 hypothetical protein [Xanthomonas arboricola pv. corylina]MEA5150838.1 hypothetical protein [Xanthomonas arboricola]
MLLEHSPLNAGDYAVSESLDALTCRIRSGEQHASVSESINVAIP